VLLRTIAHPLSVSEFLAGVKGTAITRGTVVANVGRLSNSPPQPAGGLGVHLRMTGRLLWLYRDGHYETYASAAILG